MTKHHHPHLQPSSEIEAQHSLGLRIIAIYKGVKTVCLILVAIFAFHLDREQNFEKLVHWLEHLSLTDSNGLRWRLVELLQSLGPSKFVAIGLVALAYAAIFATEGTGLWLRILAASTSAARRDIDAGAVRIDGVPVAARAYDIARADVAGRVVASGKRKVARLVDAP